MKSKWIAIYFSVASFLSAVPLFAQKSSRIAQVHGHYSYVVGAEDDITLKEALRKCQELAKADAIRKEFGEMITSDVINTSSETNGEDVRSYYWENTVAMAKGDWLGDTEKPVIEVEYLNGKLVFTADVWGTAREIVQAKTDIIWQAMTDGFEKKRKTDQYDSGDRIYIKFKSPINGYVAIYLIVGDDETSCLLPYRGDNDGKYKVSGGKEYLFFDKTVDPQAPTYRLRTSNRMEDNQIVVIFSPKPFSKCTDVTKDSRHPNSLSTHDFQKWLLYCQRSDRDMVVTKKWVTIHNKSDKKNK